MKKPHNLKGSFRWFILFTLLFALAGCSTLANMMGYDYDAETGGCARSTGGCSFMGYTTPSGGGCWGLGGPGFGDYDSTGYHGFMGTPRLKPVSSRDAGFGKGVPAYQPITPSSDSSN